jgi:hypothetical protein
VPLAYDLAKMPHLLIAGRTGTGKSVCLNAVIISILMTRRPDEVRMLMIDPKMVELSPYKCLPHLMHPVVTDMRKAEAIMGWAVDKMEERYHLLARAMRETGRAALAKWAARGKQYLVLIRAVPGGLVMQQLLYADEVRALSDVPVGEAEVKDAELQLAVQLVQQIASDEFHPEKYEDDVKKRYHEAIQRKVEGQQVAAAPEQPRGVALARPSARMGALELVPDTSRVAALRARPPAIRVHAGRGAHLRGL